MPCCVRRYRVAAEGQRSTTEIFYAKNEHEVFDAGRCYTEFELDGQRQ